MKKITWEVVKEKGRKVWEEHRNVCLAVGGVAIGVAMEMLLEEMRKKVHAPKEVDCTYDVTNGTNFRMECWHIDKKGEKTYATGFTSNPADAIHMARDILYHLAGEAE